MDPHHDLAVILSENGRIADALAVLEDGRRKSSDFCKMSDPFYEYLLNSKRGDNKEKTR